MVQDMIVTDIDRILDDILHEFEKYDGNAESGIEIIESNQSLIDKLKELFTNEDLILTVEQLKKMELVMAKQKILMDILGAEKEDLLNKIDQINQKHKVVNSYMTTNKSSIFIDKDM